MHYELIFDAEQAGYRNWWFPAFGLIFVAIGAGILLYRSVRPTPNRSRWDRRFPYLFIGFALSWMALAFLMTYVDYLHLRDALRSGNFMIVEGKVEDFVPMPASGHPAEHFQVSGHRYSYSDASVIAGFNNTQSHGGPMQQGLLVRIADVGGQIARLEIAR